MTEKTPPSENAAPSEKADSSEKPEAKASPEESENPVKPEAKDASAVPGNPDKPETIDASKESEDSENSVNPENPENSDKSEKPEKVNWLRELRGLALMLLAVLMFHSLVAKPFYIPSTSMAPNLLVGDRLIVSKYPFGWSWVSASFHIFPRGESRLLPKTPEYGDIVIAVPPNRTEDYIKRVVGLPGDRIAVEDGQIILNGRPIPQQVEPDIRLPLDPQQLCNGLPCFDYFSHYRRILDDGREVYEVPVLRETMPNGANYLIIDTRDQRLDHFPEIRIPAGHVFLMGDNRDYSADSRAKTYESGLNGPVPLANVGGRAEFITFSLDGSTGLSPGTWFSSLRDGRAWRSLRPAIAQNANNE